MYLFLLSKTYYIPTDAGKIIHKGKKIYQTKGITNLRSYKHLTYHHTVIKTCFEIKKNHHQNKRNYDAI